MRTKGKASMMVNCKACGRPFPVPAEAMQNAAHQCPSCGEESTYTSEDFVQI